MPLKVQPLDDNPAVRTDPAKPAGRSLLKRLFERQSVLKIPSGEKVGGAAAGDGNEREEVETEPNSVSLDRMILSYIEDSNEKSSRCGRRRCNCFNGNCDDSSDDDADFGEAPPIVSAAEILKGLIPCVSAAERNLLEDASMIMEQSKIGKGRRRLVADGLQAMGYDAAVCMSRWEKTASFPAGEYEYVDVIVHGERILLDVDFRSEFEIARSTKSYRAVLQCLPTLFVGQADRLKQIVAVVSEAARQSLRKKGLHFPPWRKPEYLRAKWLSGYERINASVAAVGGEEERSEDSNCKIDICDCASEAAGGEAEVGDAGGGEWTGVRAEREAVEVPFARAASEDVREEQHHMPATVNSWSH